MYHLDIPYVMNRLNDKIFHEKILSLIEDGSIKTGRDERTLQAYIWAYLVEKIKYEKLGDEFRFKQILSVNIELYDKEGDTPDITIRKIDDYKEIVLAVEIKHYIGVEIGKREENRIKKDILSLNEKQNGIFIITVTNRELYEPLFEEIEIMAGDKTNIIIINQRK